MNCIVPEKLFLSANRFRKQYRISWSGLINYLICYAEPPTEYQRKYEMHYEGKDHFLTINFLDPEWITFAKFAAYFKNHVHTLDYLMWSEEAQLNLRKKMNSSFSL